MTQPALSRLEAGGVMPTIPLLERISAALDADLIVEISPTPPDVARPLP
jgi:transcriptional regulator with XRE-family HTH domain